MERTEFVNAIKEMAEELGEVVIQPITKPELTYEGLCIRKIGVPTPVVNLDDLYKRYQNGTSIEDCIEMARKTLNASPDMVPITPEQIQDYEFIKDKLYLRLVGKIEDVGYRRVADMYLVPYVDLGDGRTFRVQPELAKIWETDIDAIYEQAKTNQETIRPAKIRNLAEMLGVPEADTPVYVISVEGNVCGAGAILYDGLAEKIRDMIGDFYVIPSSIHEVLAIPKSLTDDTKSLGRMVSSINNSSVDEDERLTDSVYTFDFDTGELVKVA